MPDIDPIALARSGSMSLEELFAATADLESKQEHDALLTLYRTWIASADIPDVPSSCWHNIGLLLLRKKDYFLAEQAIFNANKIDAESPILATALATIQSQPDYSKPDEVFYRLFDLARSGYISEHDMDMASRALNAPASLFIYFELMRLWLNNASSPKSAAHWLNFGLLAQNLDYPICARKAFLKAFDTAPCDSTIIDRILELDPSGEWSDRPGLLMRKRLLNPEEPSAAAIRQAGEYYIKNRERFVASGHGLGATWDNQARMMRDFIDTNTSVKSSVDFAIKIDFESRDRLSETDFAQALEMRADMERDYPHEKDVALYFSDSPIAPEDTVRRDGGVLVSKYLYYFARRIFKIANQIGKHDTIVDIGAGTGLHGLLWFLSGRLAPKTYIIVDIPESLYFSQLYLTAHLGEDQVGMVQDGGISPHLGKKVILVPVHEIESLYGLDIDVVTNFGSLQEMSEYWVDFYRGVLSRLNTRYFYSCNYFGQHAHSMHDSRNLWSARLSPEWRTYSIDLNPYFLRKISPTIVADHVFKKHDEPLGGKYLSSKFDELLHDRAVSLLNLFELLDVFRLTLSVDHAARIVKKFQNTYFKEVLFLARWLSSDAGAKLSPEMKDIVAKTRQRLTSQSNGGNDLFAWPERIIEKPAAPA